MAFRFHDLGVGRTVSGHAALRGFDDDRRHGNAAGAAAGRGGDRRAVENGWSRAVAGHRSATWATAVPQKTACRRRVDREQQRQDTDQQNTHPTTHGAPRKKKGQDKPGIQPPNHTTTRIKGMLIAATGRGKPPGSRTPHNRHSRHGLPMYRACSPPANGVENCETDADRARASTCFSEDPDQRCGVGTSDGTRKQVECRCPLLRPASPATCSRFPAPVDKPYGRSNRHPVCLPHAG